MGEILPIFPPIEVSLICQQYFHDVTTKQFVRMLQQWVTADKLTFLLYFAETVKLSSLDEI